MREKLEERLEEKGWRIVDVIQRGKSRGVARTQGSRGGQERERVGAGVEFVWRCWRTRWLWGEPLLLSC